MSLHTQLPLPKPVRPLLDHEKERLEAFHSGLPQDPTQCNTCSGKKTYRWWNPERTEVVEWECDCEGQWMANRWLLYRGLGHNYQRYGWLDIEVEQDKVNEVLDWVEHADAYIRAGIGLVLHGGPGSGKTLLSALVLKALLALGYEGHFTTFIELLDSYTSGWRSQEAREWFQQRVSNARVLVIDDLGKELKGRGDLPRAAFDETLRHRIAGGHPTIITCNHDLGDIKASYGGFVASLLAEQSVVMEFLGEDWRLQAHKRRIEEVKAGLTRPITFA